MPGFSTSFVLLYLIRVKSLSFTELRSLQLNFFTIESLIECKRLGPYCTSPFPRHTSWLVTVQEQAQVLPTTFAAALFYASVPVSHGSVTMSRHERCQRPPKPELLNEKNPAMIDFILSASAPCPTVWQVKMSSIKRAYGWVTRCVCGKLLNHFPVAAQAFVRACEKTCTRYWIVLRPSFYCKSEAPRWN